MVTSLLPLPDGGQLEHSEHSAPAAEILPEAAVDQAVTSGSDEALIQSSRTLTLDEQIAVAEQELYRERSLLQKEERLWQVQKEIQALRRDTSTLPRVERENAGSGTARCFGYDQLAGEPASPISKRPADDDSMGPPRKRVLSPGKSTPCDKAVQNRSDIVRGTDIEVHVAPDNSAAADQRIFDAMQIVERRFPEAAGSSKAWNHLLTYSRMQLIKFLESLPGDETDRVPCAT